MPLPPPFPSCSAKIHLGKIITSFVSSSFKNAKRFSEKKYTFLWEKYSQKLDNKNWEKGIETLFPSSRYLTFSDIHKKQAKKIIYD
jgi:hypothetical protein